MRTSILRDVYFDFKKTNTDSRMGMTHAQLCTPGSVHANSVQGASPPMRKGCATCQAHVNALSLLAGLIATSPAVQDSMGSAWPTATPEEVASVKLPHSVSHSTQIAYSHTWPKVACATPKAAFLALDDRHGRGRAVKLPAPALPWEH